MSYSLKPVDRGYLVFHDREIVGTITQTPSGYAVSLNNGEYINVSESMVAISDSFGVAVSHLSMAA